MEFGKFRGHTLGEIAAFEPSYIDWISSTISRDADLVAAAGRSCDGPGSPRHRPPAPGDGAPAAGSRAPPREWQRIFADGTGELSRGHREAGPGPDRFPRTPTIAPR